MSVNLLDQDCFHLTIRFNTKMEFTMFYKFLEHLSKMRWCAFQKKKKQKMLVGFFFFFWVFVVMLCTAEIVLGKRPRSVQDLINGRRLFVINSKKKKLCFNVYQFAEPGL